MRKHVTVREPGPSSAIRHGISAGLSAVVRILTALVLAGSYFGCAATVQEPEREQSALLPAAGQQAAAAAEDNGEYLEALRYWRQAKTQVEAKIEDISSQLRRISQWYAEIGVRFYQEKKEKKALAEFVEALRHNPDNELALAYITGKYTPQTWIDYTVRENDTPDSIAEAVYEDPAGRFAVRHFAGVDEESDLAVGTEIRLPLLDSMYSPQLRDYKRHILRARTLYTEKQFAELLPLAERILQNHPGDEEASYLLGSALVGLGEELRQRGEYGRAIEILLRVDPLYKDVEEDIADLRRLQKQQLLENAAAENALLFKEATALMAKERYLEARSVLAGIDPEYPGVRKTLADLRITLTRQADIHYKRGVAFFVEDNLAAAIDQWQMTLRYDPDHQQAAANIAKARALLEKVQSIN